MTLLNIILTILFYLMLSGILALSWLSMRNTTKLSEAAITSAEAAKTAAEVARTLAFLLKERQS